ncbi:hypothetical protein M011DRAFT_188519 [Sporormia fimetaria CBS 119925]|uniref:Uncharacterized protein n=1 Tax=Sporormia fimetaria CBS 119925 TaxID=1340428 RepID=A0A6A6VNZ0_9PLEO|nr:hypothetical protein M011DRAFT_188519 [Sporormia fimetaria CBS 119925]
MGARERSSYTLLGLCISSGFLFSTVKPMPVVLVTGQFLVCSASFLLAPVRTPFESFWKSPSLILDQVQYPEADSNARSFHFLLAVPRTHAPCLPHRPPHLPFHVKRKRRNLYAYVTNNLPHPASKQQTLPAGPCPTTITTSRPRNRPLYRNRAHTTPSHTRFSSIRTLAIMGIYQSTEKGIVVPSKSNPVVDISTLTASMVLTSQLPNGVVTFSDEWIVMSYETQAVAVIEGKLGIIDLTQAFASRAADETGGAGEMVLITYEDGKWYPPTITMTPGVGTTFDPNDFGGTTAMPSWTPKPTLTTTPSPTTPTSAPNTTENPASEPTDALYAHMGTRDNLSIILMGVFLGGTVMVFVIWGYFWIRSARKKQERRAQAGELHAVSPEDRLIGLEYLTGHKDGRFDALSVPHPTYRAYRPI